MGTPAASRKQQLPSKHTSWAANREQVVGRSASNRALSSTAADKQQQDERKLSNRLNALNFALQFNRLESSSTVVGLFISNHS